MRASNCSMPALSVSAKRSSSCRKHPCHLIGRARQLRKRLAMLATRAGTIYKKNGCAWPS